MICYSCEKIGDCSVFHELYSMSKDFCINDCKDYDEAPWNKYKRIAEHDELMKVIYDYFTHQIDSEVESKYSYEEIKDIITEAMWEL